MKNNKDIEIVIFQELEPQKKSLKSERKTSTYIKGA